MGLSRQKIEIVAVPIKNQRSDVRSRHRDEIRAEQVRLLEEQVPMSFFGMCSAIPLIAFLFWDDVAHSILIPWASAGIFWSILLGIQWVIYRRSHVPTERIPRWAMTLSVIGLGAGCTWGSAGFLLFVPGSFEQQLLLLMFLFAGTAAAAISTIAYLPTFVGLVAPFLIPLTIRLAIDGGSFQLALAAVSVAYALCVGICAYNVHRMLSESLRLRFVNVDLVNELTERTADAEKANLAKSRFLAAASHDLRQPLHALGLFVGALGARVSDPDNQDLVNKIRTSVDALDDLFNALLDISKLDAGVLEPQLKDTFIQPLMDRMESEYGPVAKEKGLDFRVSNCRESIHSDPVLLERLLRNLVSNAVNNTPSGGIELKCTRRESNLCIEVIDSGIGIPKEHLNNIFDEFYQVGNPERDRKKGLGLGLAIVDRIAKLLEYPINVSSVLDKGSIFSVEVPLAKSVPDDDILPIPDRAIPDLAGYFLVIVEDDVGVQDAMKELLNSWGCEVLVSTTARDAVDSLIDIKALPDLIIADYRLPEENTGVNAINDIRTAVGADIPAILITGDTAPDRLREAEASGYPLLHKPVPPARLRALVNHTLKRKQN